MSFRERARRMLADIIHKGPEPWKPPSVAKQPPAPSAEGLRAKEMADHKAWLRDNADSVTVPEHPAVALLRDLHALRGCVLCGHSDECAEGCRLAAILAGSKPGERALSEVLAEEREKGRQEGANELLQTARKGARALDEEIATTPIDHALADLLAEERELGRREATFRATHEEVARKLAEARAAGYDEALQKAIAERNAMYSAHELGALADELDEDNNATAAKKLRAAIATIARLEAAAKATSRRVLEVCKNGQPHLWVEDEPNWIRCENCGVKL